MFQNWRGRVEWVRVNAFVLTSSVWQSPSRYSSVTCESFPMNRRTFLRTEAHTDGTLNTRILTQSFARLADDFMHVEVDLLFQRLQKEKRKHTDTHTRTHTRTRDTHDTRMEKNARVICGRRSRIRGKRRGDDVNVPEYTSCSWSTVACAPSQITQTDTHTHTMSRYARQDHR